MIVNICVWDAQFSSDCRNPDLLWPPDSPARSLASLHCLLSFTFCHLSFVISLYVHGCSPRRLLVSHSWQARAHAHINICQQHKKPYLASREFLILCYLERVQRYKAELCMPFEGSFACCSHRKKDYNKLLAWGCSILTSAHCTLIQIVEQRWSWISEMRVRPTEMREKMILWNSTGK